MRIVVKTLANNALSEARSNANGRYQMTGLAPGTYKYILDPVASGFKGGDAVSYLSPKGLTIDWHLSATSPPIALASEGTGTVLAGDPPGLSDLEFTGIVVGGIGLVDGIGVGAYAAAGGFSGPPASPSL